MHVNGKMRHVEIVPGMGEQGDKRECCRGLNSSMMHLVHYKNFCKCNNIPSAQYNSVMKYSIYLYEVLQILKPFFSEYLPKDCFLDI
jgi:hypothetical protein